MCISWDHACVLFHAVPVSCRKKKTDRQRKMHLKNDVLRHRAGLPPYAWLKHSTLPTSTITDGRGCQVACCFGIVSFTAKMGKSKGTNRRKSQGASAVWSLLLSTVWHYDKSTIWVETVQICEEGFGRSRCCLPCCSPGRHQYKYHKRSRRPPESPGHIWYVIYIYKPLPRPHAAAAAMRAILAWVSSLTRVHSSQHCWCNWPLENINRRPQMMERIRLVPCSQWWHLLIRGRS